MLFNVLWAKKNVKILLCRKRISVKLQLSILKGPGKNIIERILGSDFLVQLGDFISTRQILYRTEEKTYKMKPFSLRMLRNRNANIRVKICTIDKLLGTAPDHAYGKEIVIDDEIENVQRLQRFENRGSMKGPYLHFWN